MKEEHSYFDVLPLHPRPQKLEALTSYVRRLAEANGIESGTDLTHTCFSDYPQAIRHLNDFPIRPLKGLQTAAICSEAQIQAMTFSHLGEKFGRTFSPNACYRFLHGSIALTERYCPFCLKERGYGSLLWRFRSLKGCSEHRCSILDRCGQCGSLLQDFPYPQLARVSICPRCGKDLGECQARPLDSADQEEAISFSRDLAFLLSPLCREMPGISLEYLIGKQFTRLREAKGLDVREMAEQMMLPAQQITGVEYTFPGTYTIPFDSYIQYAKILGSNLHSIFAKAIAQWYSEERPEIQIPEDEVIAWVQRIVDALITRRRLITKQAVFQLAQLLHAPVIPSPTLLQQLEHILIMGREEQRRKIALKNKGVEAEVLEVVRNLEAADKPVTYGTISDIMKFSYTSFEDNVWDIRAVNGIISRLLCRRQNLTGEEDVLITKIEVAIDQLNEMGEPIVRGAILRILGSSEERLDSFPRLEALLKTILKFPQHERSN